MGNSCEALYRREDLLYYHLNRQEFQQIDKILQIDPGLVNKPITKVTQHTLLMRAAYNGSIEQIKYVLGKNPDINAETKKGETALTVAVRKNQLEIVEILVGEGAKVDHNVQDLSILDLAILPGFMGIAEYLYSKTENKTLKPTQIYSTLGKKYTYRYVDYEDFLQILKGQKQLDHGDSPVYLELKKTTFEDPVPDPRETWGNWFKRNLQFKEAPMVERSSLPSELQPQNRGFTGKASIAITNWSKIDQRKSSVIRLHSCKKERDEICSQGRKNSSKAMMMTSSQI